MTSTNKVSIKEYFVNFNEEEPQKIHNQPIVEQKEEIPYQEEHKEGKKELIPNMSASFIQQRVENALNQKYLLTEEDIEELERTYIAPIYDIFLSVFIKGSNSSFALPILIKARELLFSRNESFRKQHAGEISSQYFARIEFLEYTILAQLLINEHMLTAMPSTAQDTLQDDESILEIALTPSFVRRIGKEFAVLAYSLISQGQYIKDVIEDPNIQQFCTSPENKEIIQQAFQLVYCSHIIAFIGTLKEISIPLCLKYVQHYSSKINA